MNRFKKKFKGQLQTLPSSAIALVILVVIVAMGTLVLVGMNDSTEDGDAATVIESGIDAMGTYGDWFDVLVIVIIAVVVLALLIGAFYVRRSGGFSAGA